QLARMHVAVDPRRGAVLVGVAADREQRNVAALGRLAEGSHADELGMRSGPARELRGELRVVEIFLSEHVTILNEQPQEAEMTSPFAPSRSQTNLTYSFGSFQPSLARPAATLPMKKLVIVGGGSAGWMAAMLLANALGRKGVEITVLESPTVGIIGVGEGSTPWLKGFFESL